MKDAAAVSQSHAPIADALEMRFRVQALSEDVERAILASREEVLDSFATMRRINQLFWACPVAKAEGPSPPA